MTGLDFSRVALPIVVVVALLVSVAVGSARADDGGVDAFGSDPNSLSGTVEEVCGPGPSHDAAARRPGRQALIDHLAAAFPEVEGFAGFSCREIVNRRMSCEGRSAPAFSDCWSTHAAGRAIDVMVGGAGNQPGRPVGADVGDRIVDHLLERVHGVDNYRARVMGVQQLLWNGACWSSSQHAGAGITDVSQLGQDCVDDHDNHVHITLSTAGADGSTSFHTGSADVDAGDPVPADATSADATSADTTGGDADGRGAHLLVYDAETGDTLVRGLDLEGPSSDGEAADALGPGWTALASPDVLGNGDDEVFAYRSDDGAHVIREIRGDGSLGAVVDEATVLPPGHSLAASPDLDGDGDDELLLYRADDGAWLLYEVFAGGDLGPALQPEDAAVDASFTSVSTPDLDGDGDDEVVFYRRSDGHHVVLDVTDDEADDDVVALEVVDDPRVFDREAAVAEVLGLEPPRPAAVELGMTLPAGFTSMATPDLDGDGVADVLLHRTDDDCLAIHHRSGDGTGNDVPDCDASAERSAGDGDGDDPSWLVTSTGPSGTGWTAVLSVDLRAS